MLEAAIPEFEEDRLNELYAYHILDSRPDSSFDELADLTAEVCEAPIALISLVDESRQWFKARVGLDVEETARSVSFCSHAILQDNVFIVKDTLLDARFADNPLVTGDPHIRFYAGAPLIDKHGYGLGTLCVIDTKPRDLTPAQTKALRVLRSHVMTLMKLHKQNVALRAMNKELESFSIAASHDLMAPGRRILSFSQILKEDYSDQLDENARNILDRISASAISMTDMLESLLALSRLARTDICYGHVDLSKMADEILSDLQLMAPERQLSKHIQAEIHVIADPKLMRIALENVLGNAWKYTAKKKTTRIKISMKQEREKSRITIEDNGVGFDMQFADKIFLPFQRLHSDEEFEGNGVGLATVQRIMHRHGGDVEIFSEPDTGTRVDLIL